MAPATPPPSQTRGRNGKETSDTAYTARPAATSTKTAITNPRPSAVYNAISGTFTIDATAAPSYIPHETTSHTSRSAPSPATKPEKKARLTPRSSTPSRTTSPVTTTTLNRPSTPSRITSPVTTTTLKKPSTPGRTTPSARQASLAKVLYNTDLVHTIIAVSTYSRLPTDLRRLRGGVASP